MFSERELKQTSDVVLNLADLDSGRAEQWLSDGCGRVDAYPQIFNEMVCAYALHEIICDGDGVPIDYCFLDVNPAFERIVGLKKDDVIGKSVLDIFPCMDVSWVEKYGNVALTGESAHFDDYSLFGDRFYEVNVFCPRSGEFAMTFSDITERRCAHDVLEMQERDLNKHVCELECLLKVSSIVNVLPSLNEGFREVVDTVFSDLKGRSVAGCRLIYKENIFQAGLFVDSNWNCRSDIIVDDVVHGSFEVWYSEDMPDTSADNFQNDGGFVDSVTRSLGIFVEMKLVENDLNIFKSISDKVNYGISILDMDGNIIYVNEAFSQLHGNSVEELLGTHFLMFYNDSQVPRLKRFLGNLLNSDGCMDEEVWHMRKNGSIFPAILECDLIFDRANMPSYFFVALKDITETKKADDALKRAMSIADAANCSKGELFANVSHELRTPLNAIVGFSEILLDGRCGDLNDVQRRYLQNVSNSGNNLSEIITKILEISNIEAGNAEVNVEKFKILHSVLEVKESLMHSILLKDISFVCELDPDLPQICVDKIKFKHILHNLLTNAVKFTSDRG